MGICSSTHGASHTYSTICPIKNGSAGELSVHTEPGNAEI